jgi:hypothetical protein
MKRVAILIEASRARGQKEILGAAVDVRRLREWLGSNCGGAWNEDEIRELPNPSLAQVQQAIGDAASSDFSFVSFSGHGGITEDRFGNRLQKLIIGSGEEIDLAALRPGSKRNILLCDACRIIEKLSAIYESVKAAALEQRSSSFERFRYRKAYEDAVESANPGTYTAFGCSPNEFSREDPLNGGYFTASLVQEGMKWCESQRRPAILTIDDVLLLAKARVKQLTDAQTPTGGPENRSGNSFPFAVHA